MGTKVIPMPRLTRISGGRTWARYELCTPSPVNHTSPPAASASPTIIRARGPIRGRSRLARPAPMMIPPEKGRKANPVLSAE